MGRGSDGTPSRGGDGTTARQGGCRLRAERHHGQPRVRGRADPARRRGHRRRASAPGHVRGRWYGDCRGCPTARPRLRRRHPGCRVYRSGGPRAGHPSAGDHTPLHREHPQPQRWRRHRRAADRWSGARGAQPRTPRSLRRSAAVQRRRRAGGHARPRWLPSATRSPSASARASVLRWDPWWLATPGRSRRCAGGASGSAAGCVR